MRHTGARILIEALMEQSVDTVFGYPGAAVLFIYDELYKQRDKITHILTSHEQHAAHAADGYTRASGRTGVCIATSGPGATNLVTGIAAAYMDSTPLVAVTGNVSRALLGRDSFQEVERSADEIAETVREAFLTARSGRPGPVLIDIPKDVTAQTGEWTPLHHIPQGDAASERAMRLDERSRRKTFTDEDISRAAELILNAKCPAIYAGGGVIAANAAEELLALAEFIGAPVAVSLMGTGCFPRNHPLYTGLLGMHGTVASNKAVQSADLVIALGARFSDRVTSDTATFASGAKILHYDIDPAEINKNVRAAASVIGNLKETLPLTLAKAASYGQWASGAAHIASRETARDAALPQKKLNIKTIFETVSEKLGSKTVAVTDVGQHQLWAAQFFPCGAPRSFITSGGLGAMGFGLGAAIGAKIAMPDKPVVLFTGDGSFRMNCAELSTVSAYRIPLLIVLFNNRALGMVRQWQYLFYEQRYSQTDLDRPPDFVKLADAYGVAGFRAETDAEFAAALQKAAELVAQGNAAFIEAVIDRDEKALPMVPGGSPLHEQILGMM